MKRRLFGLTILMLALALPASAGDGINSSIRIEPGDQVNRDLSTLNGKIRIGDGATVRGEAETVNGSVTIGNDVQVDSVSTVNGSIDIGEGTVVDRDVETVNGSIEMERGSRARKAGTVNGSVNLNDAEVDQSVVSGDPAACRERLRELAAKLRLELPVVDLSGADAETALRTLRACAPAPK